MKNNTFDISRFLYYVRLHYWSHKTVYLGGILAVGIILLGSLCNWEITPRILTDLSDPINSVLPRFTGKFITLGALLILIFATRSLAASSSSMHPTMNDILIPVSTFERYLFSLVNSMVVAPIIFVIIFVIIGNIAESRYLFSEDGYAYIGLFQPPHLENYLPDGFRYENFLTFGNLLDVINIDHKFISFLSLFFGCTASVSVIMWGNITFKGYGSMVSVMLHIVFYCLLLGGISKMADIMHEMFYDDSIKMAMWARYYILNQESGVLTILLSLSIITITYQWVIWKKLKSLSIK